jgi:hypothetical protein
MRGGWGYKCAFCNTGDKLSAGPNKGHSDRALFNHVIAKHANVEIVADLIRNNNEKHPNGASQLGSRS